MSDGPPPQKHLDRQFDYVVVGAGPSAVGVLLGLLEQSSSQPVPVSIVLVECGNATPDAITQELRHWYQAAHHSTSVRTLPTLITGRQMKLPIGQGLGGSSNINAGLVMHPLRSHDFRSWPEPWKSSLPEAIDFIWNRLEENAALKRTLATNCKLPVGKDDWNVDWNVPNATLEHQGPDGSTTRTNYFDTLLGNHLRLRSSAVELLLETQVQRLLVKEVKESNKQTPRTVRGVECYSLKDGSIFNLHASRAVILCAGAIETPALLLTSGIGPESHSNFQGVGRHLKDQWLLPKLFLTTWQPTYKEASSNGIAALGYLTNKTTNDIFQVGLTDWVGHETIIPSAVTLAVRTDVTSKFLRILVDLVAETVQVLLLLLIRWSPLGYFLRHFTSAALLCMMHPHSEGTVSIEHKNAQIPPSDVRRKDVTIKVDVGYCRDPKDVEMMRRAWNGVQPPLNSGLCDAMPQWLFQFLSLFGIDGFAALCAWMSQPYYHFASTCAMKRDEHHIDWVVDSERLELRDHHGIYLCDASVFPSMVSCPPALTCCALGYAFSQQVLNSTPAQQDTMMDRVSSGRQDDKS